VTDGLGSEIAIVGESWERMDEVLALYYAVLYRDYGVAHDYDWFHAHAGGELAVALSSEGAVLGAARLLPSPGDPSRQIRQVAVDPATQGAGLGRALVATLEWRAADEGAEEVWLNARDNAIAFYERIGYVAEGDVFVSELTGIPHRTMRKALQR